MDSIQNHRNRRLSGDCEALELEESGELFNGQRFQFGKVEKDLVIGRTKCEYTKHLGIIKIVNFVLSVLTTIKNKFKKES